MISNCFYTLDRDSVRHPEDLLAAVDSVVTGTPLRWFVSLVTDTEVVVEVTEYAGPPLPELPAPPPVRGNGRDVVVSLVPTGIGCAVGGYAGDAGPATALLTGCADHVVTNPNAVNASDFIRLDDRVVYTEGSSIDLFCQGAINLHLPRANRVGVIIEAADPAAVRHALSVVNAVRAVHGVEIVDYVVTDRPIGTRCTRHASGAYVGQVDDPKLLLDVAHELVDNGADAIAVATNVQDLPAAAYQQHFLGLHPNPVGGAEAVVSHLISRSLQVPSAHAPMMNFKELSDPGVVDARGAAEYVSVSGLACILVGLGRAPQIAPAPRRRIVETLSVDQVTAVVAPAAALGGVPVLYADQQGIPVIAVRDNTTILDVTAESLGLRGAIEVSNYPEAAGTVLALRRGISLDSLRRPLAGFGG